ncbi:MAG TPA: FHA domain-containing protein [Gemmataceae bacterium]|nr:FHA domain-containing protein [Gemmataceae bacterium]
MSQFFESHPPEGWPNQLREGTRLESVDEIRQAINARRMQTAKEAVVGDTTSFRAFRRPPMALLCVVDDGDDDGEWLRVRTDRFTIGRDQGDVKIPHDSLISGRHAELVREMEGGAYRWFLVDLQSTNGTYVRIGKSILKHNQELLIGSHRYRFDAAPQGVGASQEPGETAGNQPKSTSAWEGISISDLMPSLVEVSNAGDGKRFHLTGEDNRVGSSAPLCAVALIGDPLVSPQHARIYRDGKRRWIIENLKSLNGTWLRIDRIRIDTTCQFQLGEQRFLLRVL